MCPLSNGNNIIMFDYLFTTLNKSQIEILRIIEKSNLVGNIVVGNQNGTDSINKLLTQKCLVTIINQNTIGVSKNRNKLLEYSNAKYITFLDDDMVFIGDSQKNIEHQVVNKKTNCIRFNCKSSNDDRPSKILKKTGYVSFRKLSSFGLHGCFFNREFLIKNKIKFNEDIGPGTLINHGEDGVFLKDFTRKSKVFCIPALVFCIEQKESTWRGNDRNLDKELFSHGYVYYLLYGKLALLYSFLFVITHSNCYPVGTKKKDLLRWMKKGIAECEKKEKEL